LLATADLPFDHFNVGSVPDGDRFRPFCFPPEFVIDYRFIQRGVEMLAKLCWVIAAQSPQQLLRIE